MTRPASVRGHSSGRGTRSSVSWPSRSTSRNGIRRRSSWTPGLPCPSWQTGRRDGITVVNLADYDSADRLLEELVRAAPSPRGLVVVSGDRQVQRAGKRRRATVVESGPWIEELRSRRREELPPCPAPDEKPAPPATEAEVEYWLEVFGERPSADG